MMQLLTEDASKVDKRKDLVRMPKYLARFRRHVLVPL